MGWVVDCSVARSNSICVCLGALMSIAVLPVIAHRFAEGVGIEFVAEVALQATPSVFHFLIGVDIDIRG